MKTLKEHIKEAIRKELKEASNSVVDKINKNVEDGLATIKNGRLLFYMEDVDDERIAKKIAKEHGWKYHQEDSEGDILYFDKK